MSKKKKVKKKFTSDKNKKLRINIILELFVLIFAIIVFVAMVHKDYHDRPGIMTADEIIIGDVTTNSIELKWKQNRNTENYRLFYREEIENEKKDELKKENWKIINIENNPDEKNINVKINKLKEGRIYSFFVRADNAETKGFRTEINHVMTKCNQKIKTKKSITKLSSSKAFYIDTNNKSGLEFRSLDTKVAKVEKHTGKVRVQGSGETTIEITAKETPIYVETKKKVKLLVLDSKPVPAAGAATRIIYTLTPSNCKVVKSVTGDGGIHVPQGLAYTGKKYIIAYGMGGAQRIISFNVKGNKKEISVPKIALGHPNGFTYSDKTKLCYSVRGWSSGCVTYNPKTGKYGKISLPYGCSGIAYDRKNKCFYTSSRSGMRRYSGDGKFKHEKYVGMINHRGSFTQDCGGHAGIMFYCMSGGSKHGTNYIDLYDMKNGNYLGTLQCELSEVESAIADKDGFIEVLSNTSSKTDYIYKTPINVETLGEDL